MICGDVVIRLWVDNVGCGAVVVLVGCDGWVMMRDARKLFWCSWLVCRKLPERSALNRLSGYF